MMKLWSIQKLAVVFLFTFLLLLACAVLSYDNTIKLIQNQQLITQSHQVISRLEGIFSIFQVFQTAQRNYLLTAQKYINIHIQSLQNLTADHASKQQLLFLHVPINQSQAIFQSAIAILAITIGISLMLIIFLYYLLRDYILRFKQAQHKLSEQAALLNLTADAMLVQDIHRQILFWNQAAERLYGWKLEEAIGKNAVSLIYKETSLQSQEAILKVFKYDDWQGELQQVTKDGKEIVVASRWRLVRDEKGQPTTILIVNTDITQKKLLEAQLLRSQRLESIGTLASGIVHDLNNVLTPILMSVQFLQAKLPNFKYHKLLQTLENNTKRGASLARQVLSFARGIEGKWTIVQVRHLIFEIEQIITHTFPKSITCYTEIPENLWNVSGDTTQLHQVLMNLVINARDAMPNGGIISIIAENLVIDEHQTQMNFDVRMGTYILITVADTGIGIPPEIKERIFEPFFTTKDVDQGTGLGLFTVSSIINNHGGYLQVSSQVGKGTQFKVLLPSLTDSFTQPPRQELEPSTGCGELILVVDDEAEIRNLTKSTLEMYNYRVLTASNGLEAVTIYAQYQQNISLVLLDMLMPVMEGAIAIRSLQKINSNVKIIAMSGLISQQKVAEVQSMGVKAFLPKPCTAKELLLVVNAVQQSN